jgi:hypothetical protein
LDLIYNFILVDYGGLVAYFLNPIKIMEAQSFISIGNFFDATDQGGRILWVRRNNQAGQGQNGKVVGKPLFEQ